MKQKHDLIIVGGGHAGVEAANISSKIGCKIAIITMDKYSIGRMSCNPAIGGVAKGQIVREIDILGGLMAGAADFSGLQFKTLNKSKGRSVWSPRAQTDKRIYERYVSNEISQNKKISFEYTNLYANISLILDTADRKSITQWPLGFKSHFLTLPSLDDL